MKPHKTTDEHSEETRGGRARKAKKEDDNSLRDNIVDSQVPVVIPKIAKLQPGDAAPKARLM
jgi:hypothetical protein